MVNPLTKSERETLKSIFFSPEFNSPEAYRAKVKRPFELAISAIRTLGAETNGGPQLHQWIARMGEPLFLAQPPTGYADVGSSWVSPDMLLTRIWGDSAYRDPRTIDVHIRHLREKLERDAKDPEYIFTVRGVGYRFRDTSDG